MIQWDMLKKPAPEQTALDSLVPKDHLLRKIDAVIDFSFIHDRFAALYCADNGRPALDPTLMFKALFIGYLFGVRSERQLVREIEVNVTYRWFLRLKPTDRVFDASTLSQNRRRRFFGLQKANKASSAERTSAQRVQPTVCDTPDKPARLNSARPAHPSVSPAAVTGSRSFRPWPGRSNPAYRPDRMGIHISAGCGPQCFPQHRLRQVLRAPCRLQPSSQARSGDPSSR